MVARLEDLRADRLIAPMAVGEECPTAPGESFSVVAIPAGLPWPVWLPEISRGGIVGPGFSTKIHQEVLSRCPVTSLPSPS